MSDEYLFWIWLSVFVTGILPTGRREAEVRAVRRMCRVPVDLETKMFVTNNDKKVFAIFGLPEEVIALLFAYYSRSAKPLRQTLAECIEAGEIVADTGITGSGALTAKAKAFHDKWTIGYGHKSVGEHAVIHLAMEGVSILATKEIEDGRLASYTERSTRYSLFDGALADLVVTPPEIPESLVEEYRDLMRESIALYHQATAELIKRYRAEFPWDGKEPQGPYENRIKAKALDSARYILPVSLKTSVGITVNATQARHWLSKMRTSRFWEARALAELGMEEGQKICPSLLNKWEDYRRPNLELSIECPVGDKSVGILLPNGEVDIMKKMVSVILYQETVADMGTILGTVDGLKPAEMFQLIWNYTNREETKEDTDFLYHDRAWEAADFGLELTTDYGAYRDLQRMRMQVQFPQKLTPYKGFDLPPDFSDAVGKGFSKLLLRQKDFYEQTESPYCLSMAWRIGYLVKMNLREAAYQLRIRTTKQGHWSYRKVMQDLYRGLSDTLPNLMRLVKADMSDYDFARKGTETIERKTL